MIQTQIQKRISTLSSRKRFNTTKLYSTLYEQDIQQNNKRIRRLSKLKKNLETGWTYDWYAKHN